MIRFGEQLQVLEARQQNQDEIYRYKDRGLGTDMLPLLDGDPSCRLEQTKRSCTRGAHLMKNYKHMFLPNRQAWSLLTLQPVFLN